MRGYLEIAFNYLDLAMDVSSYFSAFFHFDRFLQERQYNAPIQFHWELQSCAFLDAGRQYGFTGTVWVTTDVGRSEHEIRHEWCRAVRTLAEYLSDFRLHGSQPIYPAHN